MRSGLCAAARSARRDIIYHRRGALIIRDRTKRGRYRIPLGVEKPRPHRRWWLRAWRRKKGVAYGLKEPGEVAFCVRVRVRVRVSVRV